MGWEHKFIENKGEKIGFKKQSRFVIAYFFLYPEDAAKIKLTRREKERFFLTESVKFDNSEKIFKFYRLAQLKPFLSSNPMSFFQKRSNERRIQKLKNGEEVIFIQKTNLL